MHMTISPKKIPAVGTLVNLAEAKLLIDKYNRALVTYAVRQVIARIRQEIDANTVKYSNQWILEQAEHFIRQIVTPSLRQVINATGIMLHTNLGRAPLGKQVLADITPIITGYSNTEYNLGKGRRGKRQDHITELLRYITGAEDAIVVNNNAAGIVLVLHTFAQKKEVLVSRGELIEIGGSFRIPEIMKASGAKMVEVGTTNKTRLADYEKAFSSKTALIFKAHRSNFTMKGFTEEVGVEELAAFARRKGIPFVYDMGSGLLHKPHALALENEPDVRSVLAHDVPLVTFSCDKLLGGPQAGIIAGKHNLVARCSKAPLMRALRVCKVTLAALNSVCRSYLDHEQLVRENPTQKLLNQRSSDVLQKAHSLQNAFAQHEIESEIVPGIAQCGGGTLPELEIQSYAVALALKNNSGKSKKSNAEKMFTHLLHASPPIVAVLREGNCVFEMHTIFTEDIPVIAQTVAEIQQQYNL